MAIQVSSPLEFDGNGLYHTQQVLYTYNSIVCVRKYAAASPPPILGQHRFVVPAWRCPEQPAGAQGSEPRTVSSCERKEITHECIVGMVDNPVRA